jgi:hypothetical protein
MGRQIPRRATACELTKRGPVHLRFLSRKRGAPEECFGWLTRTQPPYQLPNVARATAVAALLNHPQHTRSGDVGIASQRLTDKTWRTALDAAWMSAPQLKQEEATKVATLNGFAEVTCVKRRTLGMIVGSTVLGAFRRRARALGAQ